MIFVRKIFNLKNINFCSERFLNCLDQNSGAVNSICKYHKWYHCYPSV